MYCHEVNGSVHNSKFISYLKLRIIIISLIHPKKNILSKIELNSWNIVLIIYEIKDTSIFNK
jgi:hypothetical protein